MLPRARSIWSLLLGIVLVVAVVTPTTAEWSEPVSLTSFGFEPAVAMSPGVPGFAVFTWLTGERAQTATWSASAGWSAIRNVSESGHRAWATRVAVDADGNAVFAWTRFDQDFNQRVYTRRRTAAGTLTPIRVLSPADVDADIIQVVVTPGGDAVFLWSHTSTITQPRSIQMRAESASGVLGPIETVAIGGPWARVALDGDGNAVFAFIGRSPEGRRQVHSRTRLASGIMTAMLPLSPSDRDAYVPRVGVTATGDAVFVWQLAIGSSRSRIQTRSRSAAGVLSDIQTISGTGTQYAEQYVHSPDVGVDAAGNAVFVWSRADTRGPAEGVLARSRSAAGELAAIQTLSTEGGIFPRVVVAPSGDAVLMWITAIERRLVTRTRSAAGRLRALAVHSTPAFREDLPLADVAIDADGDAAIVYEAGRAIEARTGS